MSASLVGSEMCIRDRIHPTRRRLVGSACFCAMNPMTAGKRAGGSVRGTCLLYTSDAADDM
eukprot:1417802-Alexandrium_andersonii.AAC.1